MGVEGSGRARTAALLRRRWSAPRARSRSPARRTSNSRRAYVPATRAQSLYSNFSVGENLLVRLGAPEIAGSLLALKKAPHGGARARSGAALPGQDADDDAADPLAVGRQSAEGRDRPGAELLAGAAAAGGADARRRHPFEERNLPPAARLRRERKGRHRVLHGSARRSSRSPTAPMSSARAGCRRG